MARVPPQPVAFKPRFKAKPWGGRRLAELFEKDLPPGPIGESWELVSFPGEESVVRDGPLAGVTLAELVERWGQDLLGGASLADGRFPLLIKFLDARQNLSVQAHPKPHGPGRDQSGVKHESWFVVDASDDACLYIGVREGVTPAELQAAAGTPRIVDLLVRRPVSRGDCFYLPSGTPHALGAGLVVAEIQTPSDTTYRLYDWGRVGLDGRPRALHIEEALANIRCDVPEEEIVPCTPDRSRKNLEPGMNVERLVACPRFQVQRITCRDVGFTSAFDAMTVLVVLAGHGAWEWSGGACRFRPGDVLLAPAAAPPLTLSAADGFEALAVTCPSRPRP